HHVVGEPIQERRHLATGDEVLRAESGSGIVTPRVMSFSSIHAISAANRWSSETSVKLVTAATAVVATTRAMAPTTVRTTVRLPALVALNMPSVCFSFVRIEAVAP